MAQKCSNEVTLENRRKFKILVSRPRQVEQYVAVYPSRYYDGKMMLSGDLSEMADAMKLEGLL